MSQLIQLMFDVGDYATANPLGGNKVPVITYLAKDPEGGGYLVQGTDKLLGALQTNTDGKIGLCIYVFQPLCGTQSADTPGPYFSKGTVALLVCEDQIANAGVDGFAQADTPIRADDLALYLAQLFHQFYNNGTCQTLTCKYCNPLQLGGIPDDIRDSLKGRDMVFWIILLEFAMPTDQLARTANPVIAVGETQTAITGPGGSDVYCTIDGTLPTPTNNVGGANPAPFNNPPSGTLIRAAAYLAGKVGSFTIAQEIP